MLPSFSLVTILALGLSLALPAQASDAFGSNRLSRHGHSVHHRRVSHPKDVRNADPVANVVLPRSAVRKNNNKRSCKSKQTSTSLSSASSTSTVSSSTAAGPAAGAVNVAPSPQSQEQPSSSTPPPAKPTTTKAAAPPASTPANSGGSGGGAVAGLQTNSQQAGGAYGYSSYSSNGGTGDITYYGTGLGACGITNSDTDHIAAASTFLFDNFPGYSGGNPNANPICNKRVKITYQGKSTTVAITDRCEACHQGDLDLSPTAFNELADQGLGRLHGATWVWL